MIKHNQQYDSVIIGGGLAGLVSGIALQQAGYQSVIVEQMSRTGGLCGTTILQGHEFVLACNDFGQSIKKQFKALGIEQAFKPSRMIFNFSFGKVTLPSLAVFFTLLGFLPDLLRLKKAVGAMTKGQYDYVYLDQLVNNHVRNDNFKEFVYSIAYALGTPPQLVRLTDVGASLFSKELAYGYDRSVIPLGGPGKMVENMTKRYRQLGGEIRLNSRVESHQQMDNGLHQVVLAGQQLIRGKTLISSEGRLAQYPDNFQSGLKLAMLHLKIDQQFKYPDKVHGIGHMPTGIELWLNQLHQGVLPDDFGFHFFKSDLSVSDGCYALSVYYFAPRNMLVFGKKERETIRKTIITNMNQYLPGLSDAIVFEQMIDPTEFSHNNQGLSSAVFARVITGDFDKPDIYDTQGDVYYVGNTVKPIGEHAAGAILSAIRASDQVKARLAEQ